MLDAAIDPDAVLEMDHVRTGRERPHRGGGDRLPVPPGAPDAPRPPENLMVGEHGESPHGKPAVEGAQRERQIGARPPGRGGRRLQQLFQAFQLAFVVAQHHDRRRLGHLRDARNVPLDGGRRGKLEV